MPTELLIIGASGHAKVVIEAVQAESSACDIRITDQDVLKTGKKLLKIFSIEMLDNWERLPKQFHVAIGGNNFRRELVELAIQHDKEYVTIVHPDSSVSVSASLGHGSFIAARSVVGAEVLIGDGCIINHGSIVDHDCRIGAYSHIAPNATLGGGVTIGEGCLVGAGAVILPQIKIGQNSVIGAGAVVTSDIPENQIVTGVPGRCIK